jgi:excisionase family DNA binding protein
MELLTPDQLAEWLHLSRRSVYELCSARGQQKQKAPLPFLRIAGKLRFSREAINQWLLKMQEKQAA